MTSNWFIKFIPAKWLQDTRVLSRSAKGLWIDLICACHESNTYGKISWSFEQCDNFLGPNWMNDLLEIQRTNTANISIAPVGNAVTGLLPLVTVECRRMAREEHQRNRALRKQRAYRYRLVT